MFRPDGGPESSVAEGVSIYAGVLQNAPALQGFVLEPRPEAFEADKGMDEQSDDPVPDAEIVQTAKLFTKPA